MSTSSSLEPQAAIQHIRTTKIILDIILSNLAWPINGWALLSCQGPLPYTLIHFADRAF